MYLSYNKYKFYPACESEKIVFGSKRPGYGDGTATVSETSVNQWIDFVIKNKIEAVCVLLSDHELKKYYEFDLISKYKQIFGESNLLHAPVKDYNLIEYNLLHSSVIPFLKFNNLAGQKVVVHCSGGSGRTGHVLASWLVQGRNFTIKEALTKVNKLRNPFEAISFGNGTIEDLTKLIGG